MRDKDNNLVQPVEPFIYSLYSICLVRISPAHQVVSDVDTKLSGTDVVAYLVEEYL